MLVTSSHMRSSQSVPNFASAVKSDVAEPEPISPGKSRTPRSNMSVV